MENVVQCSKRFVLRSEPNSERNIREGDVAIIQERHERLKPVLIHQEGEIQNQYGRFRHSNLIGQPYGTRWLSDSRREGYMYVWPVTTNLWTTGLRHRTQVVYSHDIAFVLTRLEVRSGDVVIEAGTGSTSMTHALARVVAPHGRVISYDVHEGRVRQATEEMEKIGLGDVVSITHRDVLKEGFGVQQDSFLVDAIFLDLPSVHLCVAHAEQVLKPGGKVCFFSPCVEQVSQTKEELSTRRFIQVKTFTCTVRSYEVREETFEKLNVHETGLDSGGSTSASPVQLERPPSGSITCRPTREIKGHTSFLTFAEKALGHP